MNTKLDSGIGNIYAAEPLFATHLATTPLACALTLDDYTRIMLSGFFA